MDGHMQTDFMKYLQSEVEKYRGVMVPVKASLAERMAVKMVPVKSIHPNPDDEFCDPLIGPNYGIISQYERIFREERTMRPSSHDERLTVEKVHPDGYMLLNGHHRWAAGLRVGFKWMPVSIVNLTQETDIEKMLQASTHDRRVTLDLDEVIFCKDGMPAEKTLPFPYRSLYREPIRLGVPALLHFLSMRGYDIWVYTAELYSLEYIREYFRRYSAKVDGIITGTGRKAGSREDAQKRVRELFTARYGETLHIDSHSVVRTFRDGRDFEEYAIPDDASRWSKQVMDILKRCR